MSLTATAPVTTGTTERGRSRAGTIAAFAFAASIFMTVAVVNVPHDATDAELVAWWQDQANRTSGFVSGLFALSTAVLLAVLANHVHHSVETRSAPALRAFTRSMASAFTALMLVSAAARSAIRHLVDVMDEPLPGPDTLRYATALNYQVLGFAAMGALGLTMLATSVLALRTGVYARWAAYVGAVCGALTVVAVAVGFGIFTVPLAMLWAVTTGLALRPGAKR